MKELDIHNIHPYHGKFYCGIPQYFLNVYGENATNILDPFCGSGTTLVEASVYGKNSVGVDINFLSCKISKAKITNVDGSIFNEYLKLILSETDDADIGFRDADYWYSRKNYKELCSIYNGVEKISDENYKNVFEVILSSILKTCCNKREVWNNGYIADNVLPNVQSKISVKKMFENKALKFFKASQEFNRLNKGTAVVLQSDIIDFKPRNQFDMIITSPPYPFAVDFAKYNRLSYYLFKQDLNSAVINETGARSKRNTKNCVDVFFEEMKRLYVHIMSLVKSGGYACMTVGNTHHKNQEIDFVNWVINLFINHGWSLIEDTERELTKQSMPQKRIPTEHILVFRKDD